MGSIIYCREIYAYWCFGAEEVPQSLKYLHNALIDTSKEICNYRC